MTSVFVIQPGTAFSTADVCTGIVDGLQMNGIDVHLYRLDLHYKNLMGMADALAARGDWINDKALDIYAAHPAGMEALARRPDLVLVISGGNLHPTVPATLRMYGLRTAVVLTESPYELTHERRIAQWYDVVFTNERNAVSVLDHPNAHYLPHAFNPRVHCRGPYQHEKQCDVLFIGTGFPERRALFGGVNWEGIHYVQKGFLWEDDDAIAATDLRNPTGIIPNEDTAIWYRSAAINLNHHRTTTLYGADAHIPDGTAVSLGPRAYEIAACGGFQLSDDSRAEQQDVFGGTVPTYRAGDSADLERHIRYYLARPDERQRLRQAQYQAVQPHSWFHRSRTLLELAL